ncbi:MAG: hypothetical protein HRT72_03215 [Flavobacteriales bacterium]|nr:hypothetical protein [Flavobacteriales bacterium]
MIRLNILLALFFFFSCNQKAAESIKAESVSKHVYNKWLHSREEDTEYIKVYRPSTYQFPPSRGRRGFEIKEDGIFALIKIGITDIPDIVIGKWTSNSSNKIEVKFDNSEENDLNLNITLITKEVMKIKKL